MTHPPPTSTLFPTRRSSDLRHRARLARHETGVRLDPEDAREPQQHQRQRDPEQPSAVAFPLGGHPADPGQLIGAHPLLAALDEIVGSDDAVVPELQELLLAPNRQGLSAARLPDQQLHAPVTLGIAHGSGNPRTTRRGANPVTRLAPPNVAKATLPIRTAARHSTFDPCKLPIFL